MTRLTLQRAAGALRTFALSLPDAYEETPWGHLAIKVKGKAFLFIGGARPEFTLSLKLPSSGDAALALPFTKPTGYGLGKSGWVSASFGPADRVPLALLKMWVEESYQAIAPKRRAAAAPGKPARKRAVGKRRT